MNHPASRRDLSAKVIHFTKGEQAFDTLRSIIDEARLIGNNGMIRGGYRCVCFTEAPLPRGARYSQFGLMFDKSWIFARGGRPVIYQSESEFVDLPEHVRWRHVRYELGGDVPVDFTWEREWRIRCDELRFSPLEATIVVPSSNWLRTLVNMHGWRQDWIVQQYATALDAKIAELAREDFYWNVVSLTEFNHERQC